MNDTCIISPTSRFVTSLESPQVKKSLSHAGLDRQLSKKMRETEREKGRGAIHFFKTRVWSDISVSVTEKHVFLARESRIGT